jgi:hypothetical protein
VRWVEPLKARTGGRRLGLSRNKPAGPPGGAVLRPRNRTQSRHALRARLTSLFERNALLCLLAGVRQNQELS